MSGAVAVAVVGAAVGVAVTLGSSGPPPVIPLDQFVPANASCQTASQPLFGQDFAGATILKCETSAGLAAYAFRFDNNADYSAGLAKANSSTGWDAASSGVNVNANGCPITDAAGLGFEFWTDQAFSATRQDQFEECYKNQAGQPWFLQTWPSQLTFYTGQVSPNAMSLP